MWDLAVSEGEGNRFLQNICSHVVPIFGVFILLCFFKNGSMIPSTEILLMCVTFHYMLKPQLMCHLQMALCLKRSIYLMSCLHFIELVPLLMYSHLDVWSISLVICLFIKI
jgi:hypothetical protein